MTAGAAICCSLDHKDSEGSKAPDAADAHGQVAQVLESAEAAFIRVGIPWLPPTGRVRAMRTGAERSAALFVRYGLVGVSTPSLQAIADGLAGTPNSARALATLGVRAPTLFERYAFCLLLMTGGSLISALLLDAVLPDASFVMVGTLAVMVSLLFAGILFSSDSYRRGTFVELIRGEIDRRHGQDTPGSNKLRVCATLDG